MTTPVFAAQQIDNAIRMGMRGYPQNYSLAAAEARQKSVAYRDNLAHYRNLARRCLAERDYRQAAEKSWGAYAQTIKATGAGYGMNVNTHRNVLSVAQELTALAATTDAAAAAKLRNGFHMARSLHQHFYENDLRDAEVEQGAADVMDAIDLLQALFYSRT